MNKKIESEKAQQLVTVRLARPGYIPVAIPAKLRMTRFPLKLIAITRFGDFELLPTPHKHVYSQEEFESKMDSEPPLDPDPFYIDAEGWFPEFDDEDEELDRNQG
ncbi:hypothetical protein BI364_10385 [Acidihalobacter yilgarnensis]|uniref:Uncharacterized protein n=1 Tax=Acidihalobacter yilgarnensis TaxID=2819280 RepID=A0A1D8IPK2_9GAMM|nr:hypothetical protein [Acidihalobacter yilgarnensis]AOU98314.1 hypothetical protein BI364_10385 [Acidihalobacter yilgarnensis]